jgi:DNA-directed RNA polymerase subunit M/transcription elongation factor TFIIS
VADPEASMPKTTVRNLTCPHCHSPRVLRLPHSSDASTSTEYFRCASCGHRWTEPKIKGTESHRVV